MASFILDCTKKKLKVSVHFNDIVWSYLNVAGHFSYLEAQ